MTHCPKLALIAALCLGALLLPGLPEAHAQQYDDAADEAEVQFVLGNDAYQRGDFRNALSHYFASNRLAPNRNVLFNIARAYEQLRQFVEAYRYYQAFEGPMNRPAERQAALDGLERVRPYVALVEVATSPPGATIYVDRRELGGYGKTPRVLALSPGTYTFLLDMPGYVPVEKAGVELKVGERQTVHAELSRILGHLQVDGDPPGAQVRVDDREGPVVGAIPTTLDLSPGERKVVITREGYVPKELSARIEEKMTTELTVHLERQTGAIVVQSDERDALILVDGKPAGFTPAVVDNVPAGKHRLSVQAEGFRPFTTDVEVRPDDRMLVQAELSVDEDVAAASRDKETIQNAPASVNLVSEREIQAFGYFTAADAIEGLRGLYLSDDGTYVSVGERGFSPFGQYGNRLLVQLDGHTLNDDWIGSSYVGYDLLSDLSALDRIEVLRGPGSALYGTGAFFGVLNLASHDRAPRHPIAGGVAAVDEGVFRGRAYAGYAFGDDVGGWLSGGGLYGQPGDYFSPARVGSTGAPDGIAQGVGGFESGSTLGKLWWGDVVLQWYFNERNKHIPTGSFDTIFGDDRTRTDDRRAFVEVRYEPKLAPWADLKTRIYYDHYHYEGDFPYPDADSGLASESYEGNWIGTEVRALMRPVSGMRITVGTEYQLHFDNVAKGRTAIDGIYLDESHPYHLLSGYGVFDYAPIPWFGLSAGARFDGWWVSDIARSGADGSSSFLSSVNPRVALLFHPTEEGTLKLLGGTAFRAPSIFELTYWDGGITQVQSPDLDPETVYTGELEYSHRVAQGWWLTGSVFLNTITNLIEQRGSATEADPLFYVNRADDVYTVGAEAEVRKELRRGFMLYGQYSYQRTRLDNLADGSTLPNSPEHMAAIKLVAPLSAPEVRLATRLTFETGRLDREGDRTDASLLWDLSLSGDIAAAHLQYVAGVRNLLGWDVAHPVGEDVLDVTVAQPGRTFFVDLTFLY